MNNQRTAQFYMANLGSEVARVFSFKEKNDIEAMQSAIDALDNAFNSLETAYDEITSALDEIDNATA